MFTYIVQYVFISVDYYGEDWTEYAPVKVLFEDENLWIARNKMLLNLAKKEGDTEFLYFYDVEVQLKLPDSTDLINLGAWRLRYVGREVWHFDWEKEKQIFKLLGYLNLENEIFYQLTQELYTPTQGREAYEKLVEKFLEFGENISSFKSLCMMHIGLIYWRLREEKKALEYFSQGNASEIKSLFYRNQ